MATAGSLITNIQKMFGDTNGDFITNTVGLDWLNRAQRRFCHEVLALDEYKDYAIVAKANKFDFPTDAIWPVNVMWYQARVVKLEYTTPDLWAQIEEAHPYTTGTPERYAVLKRQIIVGPQIPQTASKTTTASGVIYASHTTLGLVAASGTFRSRGFVKVNSEVMEFTGVATTTLTGITRGVHNTTTASHASGDTVTQMDLIAFYRKSPAEITATTTTPDVPVVFQDYLEKYALYLAWQARGDTAKAQQVYAEFTQYEKDSVKTIGRRALDGLLHIQEKRQRWRWW